MNCIVGYTITLAIINDVTGGEKVGGELLQFFFPFSAHSPVAYRGEGPGQPAPPPYFG